MRTLIYFLANTYGGVHLRSPSGGRERALWDYTWSHTYITPEGQFGAAMQSLIEVGRITLVSLESLRAELKQECWPEWLPEAVRGSRRVRDPGTYDWFTSETAEPPPTPPPGDSLS